MLAEPETIPAPTHARAHVLPPWALWVGTDDDGTDWAFENRPRWSDSMGEWMPTRGRVTAMAVRLNRYALEEDVHPEREGNGHLYLLGKPLADYVDVAVPDAAVFVGCYGEAIHDRSGRSVGTRAEQRRTAYSVGLVLVIAVLAVIAIASRVLG